jgi:hypothetical protein
MGILIFKGFTAQRLYKSFGVKGLTEGPVSPFTLHPFSTGMDNRFNFLVKLTH